MYNLIPLVLILLSFIVIFSIISKKLPQLAILDVENLPQEKENKAKEKLIENRLKRDMANLSQGVLGFLRGVFKRLSFLSFLKEKLQAIKEKQVLEKKLADVPKSQRLEILRRQADESIKKGELEDLQMAEKHLIEAAELDSRNPEVFSDLGDLYLQMKKPAEAKQTFAYVLKLLELIDNKALEAETYFSLATACRLLQDIDGAMNNILESLKVEPNNPRYLNALLETAWQNKNLQIASEALSKLEEVNPENNKLEAWKEKLQEL